MSVIAKKGIRAVALASAVGLLLVACSPDGSLVDASRPADKAGFDPKRVKLVSAERAKVIIDRICGASLPDFKTASKPMAANGFTQPSPLGTPTVYSTTEDASVQIMDGPGLGKTCSVVIGTKDSPEAVRRAVLGTEQFTTGTSAPGVSALYKSRKVLITSLPPMNTDGVTYMGFKMLSER